MLQCVAIPFILAFIIIWTLYSTPYCFNCNPDYISGSEKYKQQLIHSFEAHGSKFTNHKSDENSELHSVIVINVIQNIFENVSYPKIKEYRERQLNFTPFELLKPDRLRPENEFHRLNRRRRSDLGYAEKDLKTVPRTLLKFRFPRNASDSLPSGNRNAITKAHSSTGNAVAR